VTKDQLIVKRVHWPKVAMFGFAVVLPAIAIGISNKHVFPKAFAIATIGLIVTVGICLISTYFSGNAEPKTRRYAMFHDLVIALILCVNFLFHFQIAREVSAAEDAREAREKATSTRETNLDRDVQRQQALAKLDAERVRLETEKLREQRRVLVQLPSSQRRGVVAPGQTAQTAIEDKANKNAAPEFSSASTLSAAMPLAVIGTPEEIRASWFDWLFWAAAAEIFTAILGGMILMMVWRWDVDGDGIDDSLQRSRPTMAMSPSPQVAAAKHGSTTFTSGGGNFTPPRS